MPDTEEVSLRNKILETSREMLIQAGYKNLSMRKIAKQIDVSATSIYIYFDSKDHLLHNLMEEAINDLSNQLEASIQGVDDPIEQLHELAHAYVNYAMQRPKQYQIIYLVRSDEMSRYPKEKFRRARRGYELVQKAIERANNTGQMNEDKPRTAAYVFWAQLHGAMTVIHSERLDKRVDPDVFVQTAIQHTLKGFSNHHNKTIGSV
ncbi:MAG: TetR/AcrR family transcriptional regulator [Bacteroidota bacterium]